MAEKPAPCTLLLMYAIFVGGSMLAIMLVTPGNSPFNIPWPQLGEYSVVKYFTTEDPLPQRISAIRAQYGDEAVLYRGQSICDDGCARSRLVSTNNSVLTLVSSKGTRQLSIGNGAAERAVVFAQCVTSDVHVFGLDMHGRARVQYPSTPGGFTRHCIIDNDNYVAIVLTGGRLVFIK